jgi:hypothetical protein
MGAAMRECDGLPEKPQFGWGTSKTLITYSTSSTGSLQCDFEEADVYTVAFEIDFPTNPAPQNPVNCVADVLWTTGGNTVKRRISVANGAAISGCAESVRVIVSDATTEYVPESAGTALPYHVNISVARGVRADTEEPATLVQFPPKATGAIFQVTAGGSITVPIPQDVGLISVNVAVSPNPPGPIADGDVVVQQLNTGTVYRQYDPRTFEWAPVLPGMDAIRIVNANANVVVASIVWGIDG